MWGSPFLLITHHDTAEINRIVSAFDATASQFDQWAQAVLEGGAVDDVTVLKTENEELSSEFSTFLNNNIDKQLLPYTSFDIGGVKETGQDVIKIMSVDQSTNIFWNDISHFENSIINILNIKEILKLSLNNCSASESFFG